MTVLFLTALAFAQIPHLIETPAQARAGLHCVWTDTGVRATISAPATNPHVNFDINGDTVTKNDVRTDQEPGDQSESGLLANAVYRAHRALAGCIARAAYAHDVEATAIMQAHPADDTALVAVLYFARIVVHRYEPQNRRVWVTLEVPYITPEKR